MSVEPMGLVQSQEEELANWYAQYEGSGSGAATSTAISTGRTAVAITTVVGAIPAEYLDSGAAISTAISGFAIRAVWPPSHPARLCHPVGHSGLPPRA